LISGAQHSEPGRTEDFHRRHIGCCGGDQSPCSKNASDTNEPIVLAEVGCLGADVACRSEGLLKNCPIAILTDDLLDDHAVGAFRDGTTREDASTLSFPDRRELFLTRERLTSDEQPSRKRDHILV